MAELCNRFLTAKRLLVDSGELAPRSWADYLATAGRLVKVCGRTRLVVDLDASDFDRLRAALAKTRGAVGIGNEVGRTRTIFKWGYEAGLLDRPVRFGPTFKKPSGRVLRLERAKKGVRMFEAVRAESASQAWLRSWFGGRRWRQLDSGLNSPEQFTFELALPCQFRAQAGPGRPILLGQPPRDHLFGLLVALFDEPDDDPVPCPSLHHRVQTPIVRAAPQMSDGLLGQVIQKRA
jgi:hypothetical protein